MILLDPQARPVIAHRGNRAHAPENTIPALLEAAALGADAVEFDLRVSADGILLLMHDATLDRTTDGGGRVDATSYSTIRRLDAGAHFTTDGRTYPWKGRGVVVPTFDEVIEALPATMPMIAELKTPAAAPALLQAIARHALTDRILVAGFDPNTTRPFLGHRIALGASTEAVRALLLPALLRRRIGMPWFRALCIPPRHHGVPIPVGALARAIAPHGGVTHVWTINKERDALRLWREGVQGIITDDPARILAVRAQRGVDAASL